MSAKFLNSFTLRGYITRSVWTRWSSGQRARVIFWLELPKMPLSPEAGYWEDAKLEERFLIAIQPTDPREATKLEDAIERRLQKDGSVHVQVDGMMCQVAYPVTEAMPGVTFVASAIGFVEELGVATGREKPPAPIIDAHGRRHMHGKSAAANDES